MILLTILGLILIGLLVTIIFTVAVGGVSLIVVFGDVIVCIGFIVWLIRYLIKRRRR